MRGALLMTLLWLGACPSGNTPAPVSVDTPTVLLRNATCPVSGEPVAGTPGNPTFKSTFLGVTLGFMCPMHMAEFEQGSEAQKAAWLERARASVARRPVP